MNETWMPTIILTLCVVLLLVVMSFFERRTRVRVFHITSFLVAAIALCLFYNNLTSGVDIISSISFLVVGGVAATICSKAATLEKTKILEESHDQEAAQKPEVSSVQAEQVSEYTEETQVQPSFNTDAIKDIESLIGKNQQKELAKEKEMEDKVLEWFNEQIVHLTKEEQFDLRNCAAGFISNNTISMKNTPLKQTTLYTQEELMKLGSAFLLTGKSREDCALFIKTVFANNFRNCELQTLQRKIVGKSTMNDLVCNAEEKE